MQYASPAAMSLSHHLVARIGPLVLAALLAAGCAKRYRFEPKELDRVQTLSKDGVAPLRVFPSAKFVVLYDEADVAEQYQVQKKIVQASDRQRIKQIITRNTPGQIVAIEQLNGVPLLKVTFDPSCRTTDCAYGFAQTEGGAYRLASVPAREGFGPARVFHNRPKARLRMQPAKMKSLAEANDVYLRKKSSGKIITIDLQVKKVIDRSVSTESQRARGID
jgi:hypothetical protein